MPVLVIWKTEADLKKLKQQRWWQNSPHVKSIGKFSNSQGHVTPKWINRFSPKSNLIEILCLSSLTARMKLIQKKLKPLRWWQNFSHVKSMGATCCHGNHSSNLICLKTLCSLSPYLIMVHKKFDQYQPTGSRDILCWKCGRRRRTIPYSYLIWAFGSGELTKKLPFSICKNVKVQVSLHMQAVLSSHLLSIDSLQYSMLVIKLCNCVGVHADLGLHYPFCTQWYFFTCNDLYNITRQVSLSVPLFPLILKALSQTEADDILIIFQRK